MTGTGTQLDPYIITTPQDLYDVRNNMTAYYELGADIDMSSWGNWTPIGNTGSPFNGYFDGKGHTISNLLIDVLPSMPTYIYIGLFGYVYIGGTYPSCIKNLTLDSMIISLPSIGSTLRIYAGFLAGTLVPGQLTDYLSGIIVKNSSMNVDTGSSVSTDRLYFGGIAAYAYIGCIDHAIIENCTFNITKTSNGAMGVGGVLGYASSTQYVYHCIVKNCEFNLINTTEDDTYAGSIVGSMKAPGDELMYCTADDTDINITIAATSNEYGNAGIICGAGLKVIGNYANNCSLTIENTNTSYGFGHIGGINAYGTNTSYNVVNNCIIKVPDRANYIMGYAVGYQTGYPESVFNFIRMKVVDKYTGQPLVVATPYYYSAGLTQYADHNKTITDLDGHQNYYLTGDEIYYYNQLYTSIQDAVLDISWAQASRYYLTYRSYLNNGMPIARLHHTDAELYPEGSGTEVDPYIISEPCQFVDTMWYKDVYFKLKNDIDFSTHKNFRSLCSAAELAEQPGPYKAYIDGDGYSVKNINITDPSYYTNDNYSIFGTLAEDTTTGLKNVTWLKNIIFDNITIDVIDTGSYDSFILGTRGNTTENLKLEKVGIINSTINCGIGNGIGSIGMLLGNISSSSTIGKRSLLDRCFIKNCALNVWMARADTYPKSIGGFSGYLPGWDYNQCYIDGLTINILNAGYALEPGYGVAVFSNSTDNNLTNCYAVNVVIRSQCPTTTGFMLTSEDSRYGGTGKVIANTYWSVDYPHSQDGTGINHSGKVYIGTPSNRTTYVNTYFDSSKLSDYAVAGLRPTPKTPVELQDIDTFVNWDFEDIWDISANVNDGMPVLQAFIDETFVYNTTLFLKGKFTRQTSNFKLLSKTSRNGSIEVGILADGRLYLYDKFYEDSGYVITKNSVPFDETVTIGISLTNSNTIIVTFNGSIQSIVLDQYEMPDGYTLLPANFDLIAYRDFVIGSPDVSISGTINRVALYNTPATVEMHKYISERF